MGAELLNQNVNADLVFESHQGLEGLEKLSPSWTKLVESLPHARFVHYPQWYRAYLSSLEMNLNRVWFIAAYRGGELVAIFPLQLQDYRIGRLKPKLLGTIDDDEMQMSDFIFERTAANADLLFALTNWLRRQRGIRWDELRLRKVPADSAIAHCVSAHMPAATVALRHDGSSYFATDGSYDQATQAMSGTFKRNLRRLSRRAESSAELRVQTCRDRKELDQALEIFVDIEASGWKGDAGRASAIRCRPAMLAFYTALVHEFGAIGASMINILWHGDEPVAGQFCIQIGRTLNILKIGFSDAHASFAPGNLLLERIIRVACEDPEIDILSLVNDPPWARNFKPLTTGMWSYCTPNWNARGALVHLSLLAKRRLEMRGAAKAAAGAAAKPEADEAEGRAESLSSAAA